MGSDEEEHLIGRIIWRTVSCITRCPIARHRTIKDIEENNWSHGTNVLHRTVAVLKTTKWTFSLWQPCFWSHDFHFLHKPIVYGVTPLLYGVALSDRVINGSLLTWNKKPHNCPSMIFWYMTIHLELQTQPTLIFRVRGSLKSGRGGVEKSNHLPLGGGGRSYNLATKNRGL